MTNNGQLIGKLCSYPQGALSVFPTILTFVAVILSLYALPAFRGEEGVSYMCIEYKVGSSNSPNATTTTTTRNYSCYSLYVSHPDYWKGSDDNEETNSWPLQLGALLGIATALSGFITLLLLLSATCFALEIRQLNRMMRTLFACSILSLSTLIALTVDPCSINNESVVANNKHRTGECSRFKTHLQDGALMLLLASFFYMWACYTIRQYAERVKTHVVLPQQIYDYQHYAQHYEGTVDELTTLNSEDSASPPRPPQTSLHSAPDCSPRPFIKEISFSDESVSSAGVHI